MWLRSFFRGRQAAAHPASTAAEVAEGMEQEPEPVTPEELAELQKAWAELTEAAKGSRVSGVQPCTRNDRSWERDPAAVRAVAAILRDFGTAGTTADHQPPGRAE
jgi:hypothetical protein